MTNWTQQEAIALCKQIEPLCPQFGCHVALTGGLLYKEGTRKDCDLLFYRIRQNSRIDKVGLFNALLAVEVQHARGHGWIHKCLWRGKGVDCFFPEEDREVPPTQPHTSSSEPR